MVRSASVLLALVAALAFAGCSVDANAPGAQRAALLAPDFIASAAADNTSDPQARWLLNQPHAVRESFVHAVLDAAGDDDLLAQAWLLRQPDAVRASYVNDVLAPKLR